MIPHIHSLSCSRCSRVSGFVPKSFILFGGVATVFQDVPSAFQSWLPLYKKNKLRYRVASRLGYKRCFRENISIAKTCIKYIYICELYLSLPNEKSHKHVPFPIDRLTDLSPSLQPWPCLDGKAISCLPEAEEQSSENALQRFHSEIGVDAGSSQHP